LKVRVLAPCAAPKPEPVTVRIVGALAGDGEMLVMVGGDVTVNDVPALGTPDTVTTIRPEVAPAGTLGTIFAAIQLVTFVTAVPLNRTVLVPWVPPKFDPLIVTVAPTDAGDGTALVIVGVGRSVNDELLLT
jgi:hypothetical protein